MDDLISRQAAIDAAIDGADDWDGGYNKYRAQIIRDALKALPSAQPDIDKQKLVRTMTAGIIATSTKDVYSCGMRNGMRWCRALLTEDDPKFEDASLYVQPEREKGTWTNDASCPFCGFQPYYSGDIHTLSFCPNCGADMRGEQDG